MLLATSLLQFHPQLQRLYCPNTDSPDPPLQSPPSAARYTSSLRWWEGCCRRRHCCHRRPCPSSLRSPQVSLQAEHISISEHTSNSTPVASTIICCCCWPRRAECCIVRFDVPELVEDTDLLRGRFAAGYCAPGAWRSWHISIRGGKSGHL
jgi:hypothetical protein